MDSHSSEIFVTKHLMRPTRGPCGPHVARACPPIWSCSKRGLPCRCCYQHRGALLPHHFTLTYQSRRYLFCCTFHGLAPSRRYLALCPVEPGLSSVAAATATASINSHRHSTIKASDPAMTDDSTQRPAHRADFWPAKTACAPARPLPGDSLMGIYTQIRYAFY